MKINSEEFQLSDRAELRYQHWQLEISAHSPGVFRLFSHTRLAFTGQLELINNDEIIRTEDFRWRFRVKANRIEQWCNVQLEEALSLGMTYTFRPDALVIEYLARHRIPTRLDMRHQIQVVRHDSVASASANDALEQIEHLQHQYHEQPSDYLLAPGNSVFREAFSATQWLFLHETFYAKL